MRDKVKAKVIELKYIATQYQFADFLAKATSTKKFSPIIKQVKGWKCQVMGEYWKYISADVTKKTKTDQEGQA